jgi:hypothetical protein
LQPFAGKHAPQYVVFQRLAMAFEPRFARGAVWGANHDLHEVQHKRLLREGQNPVPNCWNHVQWVFGARDRDDFFAKAKDLEHVGADNMSFVRDYLADWFAETLGGATNGDYEGTQT